MSCRFRPALYVFFVVLALTISFAAWHASVSLAQENGPATTSPLTADATLIGSAAPVPGGPGFYSQTALGFQPWPNQAVPFSYSGVTLYNPDTAYHAYEAMVSLPNGATITKFVVWYYDNSASYDMWAAIGRAPMDYSSVEQIAHVDSAGAATSVRYGVDSTIIDATVDMQSYTYWVEAFLPPSSNAGIVSFRIDFGYPAYLPLVTKN